MHDMLLRQKNTNNILLQDAHNLGHLNALTDGEQTIDHVLYDCKLLEQERGSLKAAVLRTENWPVSENKLINKFNKNFTKFTNNIPFDKL